MATATSDGSGTTDSGTGLSVAALFAAVAAVGTGVAALRAAGVVGQMERNYALPFFLAIGLAVAGTLLSALAVSGVLGKDGDLEALRATAGTAAAQTREVQSKVDAAFERVKAAADDNMKRSIALEALDTAESAADPMRKVAAAGAEFERHLRRGAKLQRTLATQLSKTYEVAGPVMIDDATEEGRRRLTRDAASALNAAEGAAARVAVRATRAERLAATMAQRVKGGDRDLGTVARRMVRVIGALAVGGAVVLACWLAVQAAGQSETPVIDVTTTAVVAAGDAKVATRTYDVDAHVQVNDLPAASEVTVLVDGLTGAAAPEDGTGDNSTGPRYTPTTLFHGEYGPDNEGAIDVHARVRLSRRASNSGGYDAVGIQTYVSGSSEGGGSNPCANYVKQVSGASTDQRRNRARFQPGCVVLTLPSTVASEG